MPKTFARYTRDQAIEAKRYFSGEFGAEVLCAALEFCLENGTYSYASPKHTYLSFLSEADQDEVQNSLRVVSLALPRVDVIQRSLETHQNMIAGGRTR